MEQTDQALIQQIQKQDAEAFEIFFARAAAIGESDPLVDVDSRLFVGLPPAEPGE